MRLNLGTPINNWLPGLGLEKNTGTRIFRGNGDKGDILQKKWNVKRI